MSIPTQYCLISGTPIDVAETALIMLHGRGGTAKGISTLAERLNTSDMAICAGSAGKQLVPP